MSSKRNSKNKIRFNRNRSSWLMPASLGLILLIGIITSLIQMRRTNNIRTEADTLTQSIAPTLTLYPASPPALPTNSFRPTATPKPTMAPAPTIVPGFTPNPLDMQLFVSAKIIGIGNDGNRNPMHLTRPVTLAIFDMKNQQVNQGYGYIVYDRANLFRGVIHFGPVENNTYFIKILSPHMLISVVVPTFRTLDSGKLNILPQVTLKQGDINDDNVVNITDYNLALGCFQDKKCEDKDLIDFNDDGVGNIIDYNILLHDYWESEGD